MANKNRETSFRFKQFELRNENSGMKVGTDGVLLGAYVPVPDDGQILDVGTGTGLIALMMAQRCRANIVGVEIDPVAADEAKTNAANSPWSNRITILNEDFVKYAQNTNLRFELIVSNPPYFTNGIQAVDSRGEARHVGNLNYESLISLSAKLLADDGELCMISPCEAVDDICFNATLAGLSIAECIDVVTRAGRAPIRCISRLSKVKGPQKSVTITIHNSDGSYTDEYINLTKSFYINF